MTTSVKDLVQDAIVIIENRIGTDEEEPQDQVVLGILNDADLHIRRDNGT